MSRILWPLTVFLLVLGLSLGAAIAYLAVTPTIWRATSWVLLDPQDRSAATRAAQTPPDGVDREWVASEASRVTSAEILAGVVTSENLVADPAYGTEMGLAVSRLASNINVVHSADTYVLDISADAASAEKAARLANAVASAFVTAGERRPANGAPPQIEDIRAAMRAAEQRLAGFRSEHNLTADAVTTLDPTLDRKLRELEIDLRVQREIYTRIAGEDPPSTAKSNARVIVPAQMPAKAYRPDRTLILAIASLTGLLAGAIGAYATSRLSPPKPSTRPSIPANDYWIDDEFDDIDDEDDDADEEISTHRIKRAVGRPRSRPETAESGKRPFAATIRRLGLGRSGRGPRPESPPVLAEIGMNLSEQEPGRTQSRSFRDRIASAIEIDPGHIDRVSQARFSAIMDEIEDQADGIPITLIVGTDHAMKVAAISYCLAVSASGEDRPVVLLDISEDKLRLVNSVSLSRRPGIHEVLRGDATVEEAGYPLEDANVTLISASARGKISDRIHVDEISDMMDIFADLYCHIILHAGSTPDSLLVQAMMQIADSNILVADSAAEDDPESAWSILYRAADIPNLAGVIVASDRKPAAETRRRRPRHVA